MYRFFVGKPEGKRPLGRPRRRLLDILGWICGERWGYRVLVGKPEGKRPLGRPRRRWVFNITMDLWGECSVYVLGGQTGGKEMAGQT